MPPARLPLLRALAGAFTAGAGLVHAAAAGTHDGERELVLFFAVTAVVQVGLGGAVAVARRKHAVVAAALVNLALAGAWAASRLAGQPAGVQDAAATLMELAAAAAAGAALLAARDLDALPVPGLSPVWAVALVPALLGITAGHSHTHSHQPLGIAADPIFAGADTSRASEGQLQAAKALVLTTRRAVARAFPDEASLLAAGYRSIGDGRVPGTYEHFVRFDYLTDGRELDAERIESIVLRNTGSGKRVASAMYILELGRTMADVPDIAGDLTAWHDHQNLCWDDSGTRLAGLLVNGRCLPRGTFRPTPPMLHVWLEEHECGPFAGIDGHGAGCSGHHAG